MTTALKLRKGTTAEHTTFTGALAEVTVDTDKKSLVVHDGVTVGGTTLAREDSLTKFVRHDTAAQGLTPTEKSNARTNIGLDNIDNTRDVDKPIPTATQAALDNKLSHSGGTLTGPLYLSGNAVGNLEVPTKQQVDTVINAAVSAIFVAYIGGRGQVFTATGTFTVPDGVTAVKVRGCGGGSGGGSWAGEGGTTSFGAYCSATGGSGTTPGTGSGGDINLTGGKGGKTNAAQGNPAAGGAVGGGFGGGGVTSADFLAAPTGLLGGAGHSSATATGYGNGGGCSPGTSISRTSGSAGGYFERYINGLTPGAAITVTIGQAGTAGTDGRDGAPGICIVEW
jgi:hypothetical protein